MGFGDWWNPFSGGDPALVRLWNAFSGQEGKPSITTQLQNPQPGSSYIQAIANGINKRLPQQPQIAQQPQLPVPPPITPSLQIDPQMQELLNMLKQRFNQPAPRMSSLAELQKQAQLQASMEYNPQIDAIKAAMAAQQKQTQENSILMKQLYQDLASSYGPDLSSSQAATNVAMQNETGRLDALNKTVQGEYANDASTSAYLASLGLGGSNTNVGAQDDLQFLNALNATDSKAVQDNLAQLGASNSAYLQGGASTARLKGVEGINSLFGDLSDYLATQNSQLSSINSQKGMSIANLVRQMQQAEQDRYDKFSDDNWGDLLQLAQLQNTINNQAQNYALDQYKATNQSQNVKVPTKGRSAAAYYLQQALGQQGGTSAMDKLTQIMLTHPDFVQNQSGYGTPAGEYYKMNANSAAATLARLGQEQGWNPQEINAMIQAMYAWYGQG